MQETIALYLWEDRIVTATIFDLAYGPFAAELDPEESRFGFYALGTPGITPIPVQNGAL